MSNLAQQAAKAREKQAPKYSVAQRTAARQSALTDLKALHRDEYDELYTHHLANPAK